MAFKLVPQVAPTLLASAKSMISKRGGFATKHLFVTPYHPAENFPVGDWVPHSKGGEGLEKWIQQVSMCYVYALTHIRNGLCLLVVDITGYSSTRAP